MWRSRLLLLSALSTSEIIFPLALIRANDESNVFPVRDCESMREHVFSPFLSLLSSWGRTAAQILWSSHKSPTALAIGLSPGVYYCASGHGEWIKTRRESEVAVRSWDNVDGRRVEWRNKGNPPKLIVLRQEIVLSREILQERVIKICDNFLRLWLGQCNGFFMLSLYYISR